MIYKHFVGHPRPQMPESAKLLGVIHTHYQSGTEVVRYYSDDPAADTKEFEQAKQHSKNINKQDWPLWV